MEILIKKIINNIVFCKTECGELFVEWVGDIPKPNNVYFIELEIIDDLKWGENVLLANSTDEIIFYNNEYVKLNGLLESIDDDGCATLRIDKFIIMFSCKGNTLPIGSHIVISVKHLLACPYEC